jgi:hypothetical protein
MRAGVGCRTRAPSHVPPGLGPPRGLHVAALPVPREPGAASSDLRRRAPQSRRCPRQDGLRHRQPGLFPPRRPGPPLARRRIADRHRGRPAPRGQQALPLLRPSQRRPARRRPAPLPSRPWLPGGSPHARCNLSRRRCTRMHRHGYHPSQLGIRCRESGVRVQVPSPAP